MLIEISILANKASSIRCSSKFPPSSTTDIIIGTPISLALVSAAWAIFLAISKVYRIDHLLDYNYLYALWSHFLLFLLGNTPLHI